MQIEIVFGDVENQTLSTCEVKEGACVADALTQANILEQLPENDLSELSLGIFSKKVTLQTVLEPMDRIEIYRPLIIDPKEARRLRAKDLS